MKYRFSSCVLDTERRELLVDGVARATEPKVFDLLVYLIENRNKVVSKDEIIDAVWEGRIVSDETLSSRISTARKVVDDSGQKQSIIGTMPRRGFRFVAELEKPQQNENSNVEPSTGTEKPLQKEGARVKRPVIAVLPFANIGKDPEQEYFSDGLTEDIISALAQWRMFPVISRNSSFVYKNRTVDILTVGRKLGVQYVLEGSVRKIGMRLRVAAQLIDATNGHHVWVENFDRDFSEVFALQDDISRRIAAALEPTVGRAEIDRLSTRHPDNLDAWDLYLRGRACLNEFTREGNADARDLFHKAVALDPTYSRGFADLAWAYARDLLHEYSEDRDATLAGMFEAARAAVRLDNASSRAHLLLANAHLWRNEHKLAVREARRACALNPGDLDAQYQLGNILDLIGDPEGLNLMEQAIELDRQFQPRPMQLTFLARAKLHRKDYSGAVELANQAISATPTWTQAYYILAISFGHLGDHSAAREAFRKCEGLQPGFTKTRGDWRPYTDPAANEHLRDGLRTAGLIE